MNKKTKVFILSGVFGLLFGVIYSSLFTWIQTENPFKLETFVFGTMVLVDFLVVGGFGYLLFKSSSSISSAQLKKKIVHLFIFFVLGAFLVTFLTLSLTNYLLFWAKGYETDNFLKHLFHDEFPIAIKQFFIWILIAAVIVFYMIWHQAIDREQMLREENLKYKYQTLKTQVNPHFLFNSLNTLSELVYMDSKKADNYIQKLAGVYRYILDNGENDMISLEEEITFVKQYFDLQKERTGNKAQIDIDIKNADKFRIIPISLQILVENALKHNSMSEEYPLKICIVSDNEYVTVSNEIQRKNRFDHSLGTGLANLKERAKLITGKEVIISQNNNMFEVMLPVMEL